MGTEIGDLNIIQDEDTLRRMWQDTEDFSRKKEIRLRMYRLREERLKSYYITRETTAMDSAVANRKPATSSHTESLADQGFLTLKTKEIRDSASPILDFKHQSNINSLSSNSQSEHLADQNITSSRHIAEQKSLDSVKTLNNQNQGQTSAMITTYETNAIPYDGNSITTTSQDSQDLQNNCKHSLKSVQSSASEKHYTSKHEVVTSSTTTGKSQHKVSNASYNTSVSQQVNNQNAIADNTDYRIEYINQLANNQSTGNVTSNVSQQSHECYDTNISDSKSAGKISTSRHRVHDVQNYSIPALESTVCDKTSVGSTKTSTNRLSKSKNSTNQTITANLPNVDNNIMNELHKLDSYLSTEAVVSSSIPSSPASSYTTEPLAADHRQIKETSAPTVHEPTDYMTTYQQAYSKISSDVSPTHNAFASSLRASPDRSTTSPGKRSSSKSSLDRSTPDRSPRVSPEKSSCNDLSRKFTASFQNRISRNSTHMHDFKMGSPTKYVESGRSRKLQGSSSECDSDDSTATYNTKNINSTTAKNIRNVENRQTLTQNTNTIKNQKARHILQNRYSSPTKSSGNTSEGSVEREINKVLVKSPDSSPERSAFRPIELFNSKKTTIEEKVQTEIKRQASPPKVLIAESPTRRQPKTPSSGQQPSSKTISFTTNQKTEYKQVDKRQEATVPECQQLSPHRESSPQTTTATRVSVVETIKQSNIEVQKQPFQHAISSSISGSQLSPKRQSSPQIIPSNVGAVDNTVNHSYTEIKRQSSPLINICDAPSTDQIHKPEPRCQPSLQNISSSNSANITETLDKTNSSKEISSVITNQEIKPVKSSRQQSLQTISSISNTHAEDIVDCNTLNFKKQVSTPVPGHIKESRKSNVQTVSLNGSIIVTENVNITESTKQKVTTPTKGKPDSGNEPTKSSRQPNIQTLSKTSTCITEGADDKHIDKQIQLSEKIIVSDGDHSKQSTNQEEPKKPKRKPSSQNISSTTIYTVESTNKNNNNVKKQSSPSRSFKSTTTSKEPSPSKVGKMSTDSEQTSKVELVTGSTLENASRKKITKNQQQIPEKQSKPKAKNVETINVPVINHFKSSLDSQLEIPTKKKSKSSPTVDGTSVDAKQDDIVEEVEVKNMSTSNIQNFKFQNTPTPVSSSPLKEKPSKVPIPSQRSASHNELKTPQKPKTVLTHGPVDESTDESSSSSGSSSEEEREEVIIEEIFDEFGTPLPRDTNPLDVAIKTKEEVNCENQINKDISLIPEDKVNLQTKNQTEAFIKQEKIIYEGEHDDCQPPVEQVLGKDVDKAALNDFLEWERKLGHHKHTQQIDIEQNTQKKFTNSKTKSHKQPEPQIKQQVIQLAQHCVRKDEKPFTQQQHSKTGVRSEPVETSKRSMEKRIITKTTQDSKKLLKESSQTIISAKISAKKPKEFTSRTPSKSVTKQPCSKDILQTKNIINSTAKVTKQSSDRSLKEKNDKLRMRKLDVENKAKSESIIKVAKPSNVYQRRATDQVKTSMVRRTDTNSSFSNKENRDITRTSKIICKDVSQKVPKTTRDITVIKNQISKSTDIPYTTSPLKKTGHTSVGGVSPLKTPKFGTLVQGSSKTKDKVTLQTVTICESPTKSARANPKHMSGFPKTEKVIKSTPKKLQESIGSESSSSMSSASVENLHDESTSQHVDQAELIECTIDKVQDDQKKLLTSTTEVKNINLNVVVRMPSSSRETTPNKQLDDRFCPVTDEGENLPRYADQISTPDDENETSPRKSTNVVMFEKITDLDEEDETSETEVANISVAERMTKFLESAKETSNAKQPNVIKDDLLHNREQAVSKTKEMFETIAKNQAPINGSSVAKPPPIINRPSVFKSNVTVELPGHDGPHKVVSKKLTEQDHEDYLHEHGSSERVNITKITQCFEDRAAENSKNVTNVRPKKLEPRESSPSKEKSVPKPKVRSNETSPVKPSSPVPTSPEVDSTKSSTLRISLTSIGTQESGKCAADFCTTLSHSAQKPFKTGESLSTYSDHVSPTPECRSSPKRLSSPKVASPRMQSPTKERTPSQSPNRVSPAKEVEMCGRPASPIFKGSYPSSRGTSPIKDIPSTLSNKPIQIHNLPTSPLSTHTTVSPEIKHTTHSSIKTDSKSKVIQNTTNRYEICRQSPTDSPGLQKRPIEIIQIEVKPSKQIYEHTAITNMHSTDSNNFTHIKETFNQRLTRYSDDEVSSRLTKPTESSTRRASKSPSPERALLEVPTFPHKSPSPFKEKKPKTTSSDVTSSITSTLKRRKSPSPDKTSVKLRNKFQTNTATIENNKKTFEKRLSTTGSDYQNRKKFFETNASQSAPKKGRTSSPTITATTEYEITIKSSAGKEKPGVLTSSNRIKDDKSPTRKSPTRHSLSKSPERVYQPKLITTQKVIQETTSASSNRVESKHVTAPTRTTVTTTIIEPTRISASPERGTRLDGKRKLPEKSTKKVPFGVTLRKTATPSSTTSKTSSVKQTQRVEADFSEELLASENKIEEIFDLELLERMLERAVQYDLRSRIRAQIRLVKRKLETNKTSSRTPSPEKSSPTRKTKISSTSQFTPQSTSNISHSEVDGRISGSNSRSLDRRDKVKKRLFTDEKTSTTSESKSYFTSSSTLSDHEKRTRNDSAVRISERNSLKNTDESTCQTDFGSPLNSNQNDSKSTTTESIISSYGVGPTDENGRPLFGLKALRPSSETKISEEDLDKYTEKKNNYEREITDHSGRPLFGIKALQRSSNLGEEQQHDVSLQFVTTLNQQQPSNKYNNSRTVTSESSSHVYSTRTAMKSDGSGNVSIFRDEVTGELFSKDGKEPTGKMVATRYSYQKPEGEEATVKTETKSSYLNSKSDSSDANQLGNSHQDKWKSPTSKLGSSSLIRKISNEHFEKAQRKFSSGDETSSCWNENDRRRESSSFDSKTTNSETSSRHHKTVNKVDSSEKFRSQRYSTESTTSTKGENYERKSSPDLGGEHERMHTSTTSSTYSHHQANGDQHPKVSRNDSFKDVKSKFQQATVSSALKNVGKSSDGRASPTKLKASRRSPDNENAETQSSFSSHKKNTTSSNQSADGSYYYETKSYTENSSANSQDLLNRIRNNSYHPRSEFTDEEKEAVSLLNKIVGKSVSLRELESVPKTNDSNESTSSKAATLVRKFEIQQNKTKQSKEDINVEQIWDEDQLRNLLEACTDYESRRQIRARLRAIMAENKETSPTRTVTTSRSDSFSSVTKVQSKTSSTSRMVKANSVTSPFSKFRQLERQNSLPSSGAPTIKFTNPNLTRSATSIKDRLLNWVKAQTKEYENVQIDNFSTSWNNGLAFCALIHHFCPHAFDYNKLTPDQRRHNFELAFRVAEEEAGIVPLLDVEDMVVMLRPDWKCVFTYVQSVYQRFQATAAAVRP